MRYAVKRKQPNSKMCMVCGLKNSFGLRAAFYELENDELMAVVGENLVSARVLTRLLYLRHMKLPHLFLFILHDLIQLPFVKCYGIRF